MTMMQLFGKHEVSHVIRLPDSGKVSVATEHYDSVSNVATNVSVSLFFDNLEDAARYALDMLTKVVAGMKEKYDAETR